MIKKLLTKYDKDVGLLVIRVGIGAMFINHGFSKIAGGPEKWEKIGMAIGKLGIDFMPVFWGFMAAGSEFFGGICLVIGLMFRPAATLMLMTMIVAASKHILTVGEGFGMASHAIEAGILFLGLIIIGPGKYSIDKKLFG